MTEQQDRVRLIELIAAQLRTNYRFALAYPESVEQTSEMDAMALVAIGYGVWRWMR